MDIAVLKRQFTISDYRQMYRAGILAEDDRVELLDGEMYQMSPLGPWHIVVTNRLTKMLVHLVGDDAVVSVQNAIQLNDVSEPQPDIAVVHPRADTYTEQSIQASDVYLIIEVADTSLGYDRGQKLPRYAQAAIPEVWIIDINGRCIEQYSQPFEDQYKVLYRWVQQDSVTSTAVPRIRIHVHDIFR